MLNEQAPRRNLFKDLEFPNGAPPLVNFILAPSYHEKIEVTTITPNLEDPENRYSVKLAKIKTDSSETIATIDVTARDVGKALRWLDMTNDELNPLEGRRNLFESGTAGCGYNSPKSKRLRETMEIMGASLLLSDLQLEGLKLSRKPNS